MGRFALRLAFVLSALSIVVTAVAATRGARYDAETKRLTALMSAQELDLQRRVLDAHADRADLVMALLRVQSARASQAEGARHLDIDLAERTFALVEDGRTLREAPIIPGPEDPIAGPEGQRWFFPLPRGELTIGHVGADEEAEVPAWWYARSGQVDPGPGARERGLIYGAATVVLSDGSVLYASPEVGPWAGDAVRPGGLEVGADDLKAILPNLEPGMAVYVY